jgi:hypothetical protein
LTVMTNRINPLTLMPTTMTLMTIRTSARLMTTTKLLPILTALMMTSSTTPTAADLDVHLSHEPVEGVYNAAVVEVDDNEERLGEPIIVEDDDEEEEIMSDYDNDGPDNKSEPDLTTMN